MKAETKAFILIPSQKVKCKKYRKFENNFTIIFFVFAVFVVFVTSHISNLSRLARVQSYCIHGKLLVRPTNAQVYYTAHTVYIGGCCSNINYLIQRVRSWAYRNSLFKGQMELSRTSDELLPLLIYSHNSQNFGNICLVLHLFNALIPSHVVIPLNNCLKGED